MSQRVLVTAGASGIGREIVRAFSSIGAKVFVVDVDADGLSALAEEIPGLRIAVCDMARRADIERMVPEAVEALGGLDVLVNNAGIAGPTAPVEHDEAGDPAPEEVVVGRRDHHVVDGRPVWVSEPFRVFRDQVGPDRIHEDAVP